MKNLLVMIPIMSVVGAVVQATAASFSGLGELPGGTLSILPTAVSADGSAVVGEWSLGNGDVEAFLWTQASGMIGLGALPGQLRSQALSVSADGSVVVGYSGSGISNEAFRWTQSGGMSGLGALPGQLRSLALAVSADGSVVIGVCSEPFRWTKESGMVGLGAMGSLPGSDLYSVAAGVAADRAVLVGNGLTVSYPRISTAFRWIEGGGMIALGDLPGGKVYSNATGVSTDGSVVIGYSESGNGSEAFRWKEGIGMLGLGDMAGGSFSSVAYGVSADGAIIVGRGTSAFGSEAFVWDSANGLQCLEGTLLNQGLGPLLSDWKLLVATCVSADGRFIAGVGTNPAGRTEAFLAEVPEPGTFWLAAVAIVAAVVAANRATAGLT